ncbi:hypothetical protein ABFS83_12G086300 [Erythranthe nasuta]
MASRKMIFLVAIFLIGYVSAQMCNVDSDCPSQVQCAPPPFEPFFFCFEGLCYCGDHKFPGCHKDGDCGDCDNDKPVCIHNVCVCSKNHKANSETSTSVHH